MTAKKPVATKPAAKPPAATRQSRARRKAVPMAKKGRSTTDDGLSAVQVKALCALVRGESLELAARNAGMSLSGLRYALTIPAFKAALTNAQGELRQSAAIDAAGIVDHLLPVLRVDIRQFYGANGSLLPMSEWSEEMGKAVSAIETEQIFEGFGKERTYVGDLVKVKFWPKTEAADKIARILGLYAPEKKLITGVVGVVVVPAKTPSPESSRSAAGRIVADVAKVQ